MASGKKNYFRHSFNARNDEFIIELINEFKEKGYFMWFALIEICAEMVNDGHSQPVKIHRSRLIRELRCNESTLKVFLRYCEGSSKVLHTYLEPTFSLEIPNLPKYIGKFSENAPKEKKEKEKKIKELKENSDSDFSGQKNSKPKKILPQVKDEENLKTNPPLFEIEAPSLDEEISLSDLERNALTALNSICGKSFRPTPGNMKFIRARVKEGYKFEDFVKVIKHKQGQWGNDPKFRTYLRPETIFGTKFDSYLAEASDERLKEIEANKLIAEFFPGFVG